MKRYLILLTAMASFAAQAQKSPFSERAQQYIIKYKDWAVAEQQRAGIPAAITLAQGVHETDGGASELATMANNHFGIKCKKEWTGETFAHDDDAPQECFRKYGSALESYKDHSDYLKNSKRYASCFALSATDYAGWARELKKCGYATNPAYAQKLIKIIEDYHLQEYTLAALKPSADKPVAFIASAAEPAAAAMMLEKASPGEVIPEQDTPADQPAYGQIMRKDGRKGFWARRGDVLLEYAIQHKVRYAKLLEINTLPDAPLAQDQFIYLEHGGAVERMMAKDVSTPTASAAVSAPPAAEPSVTAIAPAPADIAAPVAEASIPQETSATPEAQPVKAEPAPAQQPASSTIPATPANISAIDATAEAEARLFGDLTKPKETKQAATNETSSPAINIANEKAVEEQKPEEPQDEFSKLKARMDKVVFAPSKPAQAQAPAPAAATPALVQNVSAASAGPAYHTVKAGETAFGISKQYGITMQQLMYLNKLSFGSGIKVGQKLRVK